MNRFSRTSCVVILAVALFACSPVLAFAADFSVTPLIIDLKANTRDILKETIGVMNSANRIGNIYAFVNNTDPILGREEWKSPSNTDVADSLANWIEINRATLALLPEEKKELPLLIQVDRNAKPGIYHATITFSEGGTRAEAEQNIKNGISVAINLEVLDDAKEVLELGSFVSKDTFVSGKEASFSYDIKNIGNRPLSPKGEVRIFNRSGEEVATLKVNETGEVLDPNGTSQLASVWNAGSRFGRYKAMLSVEYGGKQRGMLQDTVFFWLIPWKEILIIFICLLTVMLSFVMYWHNNYSLNQRQRLAHAMVSDFPRNAPAVQHQVYTPAGRPVSITRPETTVPFVANKNFRPAVMKREISTEAVRIQPKKEADIGPGNVKKYVVNLKK
jgi:hypothetical protein